MKRTGGQIVVEALVNEGVPYLVGIPGHGTLGLSDALIGEERLKVLQVRHDQAAVHLADAYYRVAGVPLAIYTSIGPGAMNTVVGVASCYVDSIPVLVRARSWPPLSNTTCPSSMWLPTMPAGSPSATRRRPPTPRNGPRGPSSCEALARMGSR